MSVQAVSNVESFDIKVIPDPPALDGTLIESGDSWEFSIGQARSPLTASTAPEDAAYRAQCLRALTIGLSRSHDRLGKAFGDHTMWVPAKNEVSMDKYLVSSNRDPSSSYGYLFRLRTQYTNAQLQLRGRYCANSKEKFLNMCLQVHTLAIRLIINRMMAANHVAHIRVEGRNNQAVELEVRLKRWDQQLGRKLAKFCSRHPWLKLDFENTFNATRQKSRLYEETLIFLPDLNGKVISRLSDIPATGVDCPICTEDLYVGPSDDLVEEQPVPDQELVPVVSINNPSSQTRLGGIFKYMAAGLWPLQGVATTKLRGIMEDVARVFWRPDLGTDSTPISPPTPVLRYNYTKECTFSCIKQANIDFWDALDSEDNALPKPVFCRDCQNGFHAECLDQWVNGDEDGFKLDCPFCRTPFSPDFVETKI
ncbi:hypothetical protein LTR84_005577 [Exophiala bonariae]|uniref:RING-type domain-containing protein n=1 Tax=Exophiala bonariae TaxID=1690606 RepID=A0AAV9N5L4_9EURO|nr:hypothetical protein LTR84_005577 [Exophiala bonariae]